MTFLRNCWYIAAWDHEVTADAPLSRRLLDELVVLFRDANNAPVAISGVCPHRLAPLGAGRLEHGVVHCAYHGLGFDRTGACVHNPFGTPSRTMKVQTWPVVEQFSAIWIWMGDADKADPSSIGDFAFNDPAETYVGKGYLLSKRVMSWRSTTSSISATFSSCTPPRWAAVRWPMPAMSGNKTARLFGRTAM